ncbi:MAG TPA: protocatechuate dioxygenase [Cellvibrio sp.]|nr:protocatechuate dioxygenase [Cellvibrio sp.]
MTVSKSNNEKAVDINRRKALGTLGAFSALGAAGLVGCGGGSSATSSSASSSTAASLASSSSLANSAASSLATSSAASSSAATSSCVLIPTETIGPFPLSTLLNSSTVFREAINEDKTGVPLTIKLKLVDVDNSCNMVTGYVYIWHCDKDGLYSGYSQNNNQGQAGKTYCRGVQNTDSNGVATFTTIYPGWYAGRITHIHFQVFLTGYSSSAKSTAISQMAFPAEVTTAVYNSELYKSKGQNTSVPNFSADNVFSDGVTYQLATVSGSLEEGYTAELTVGIRM